MNKLVALACAAGLAGSVVAGELKSYQDYTYDQFLTEFKSNTDSLSLYNIEEYMKRKDIFESNLKRIEEHNALYKQGKKSWYMSVNPYADLTTKEFLSRYTGYDKSTSLSDKRNLMDSYLLENEFNVKDLPEEVDNSKYLTAVKNQGKCGSCWAFASTAAAEAAVALYTQQVAPVLSTQAFTSCTPNPKRCGGTGGCKGSTAQNAYTWAASLPGLPLESDYPYTSGTTTETGECGYTGTEFESAAKVLGYLQIPPNDKAAHMSALSMGHVLTVSVAASSMHFYGGGIYNACSTGEYSTDEDKYPDSVVNHLVVLYGYTKDSWLVRNSWGEAWGESGNIRLAKRAGDREICYMDNKWSSGSGCEGDPEDVIGCGECLILIDSTIAMATGP